MAARQRRREEAGSGEGGGDGRDGGVGGGGECGVGGRGGGGGEGSGGGRDDGGRGGGEALKSHELCTEQTDGGRSAKGCTVVATTTPHTIQRSITIPPTGDRRRGRDIAALN